MAAADFWTGYRVTARQPDELVLRIAVPLPAERRLRFRKVGTRRAQAISKVVMAIAWRVDGRVWHDVRVALGSIAATPVRVPAAEAVLEGSSADEATADAAVAAITAAITPIDDVRSTADYRREVTGRNPPPPAARRGRLVGPRFRNDRYRGVSLTGSQRPRTRSPVPPAP